MSRDTAGMDRRAFLLMVGAGLLAAPLVAEAHDSTKLPRIGSLAPRTKADGARYHNANWFYPPCEAHDG